MSRIESGDCRDIMRRWIAEGVRVQTCVTSPPYWGLRDYGTAQWEGGDDDCEHASVRRDGSQSDSFLTSKQATSAGSSRDPVRPDCRKCGATRIDRQLGLEPTIAEYVANMVEVFRLVRELLADDGTLWLNLGDAYNAYNGGAGPSSSISAGASTTERPALEPGFGLRSKTLKPKDLCGVPWRVAFSLQADGWYLRQDIIWAKPNPMPESVTDRCTKSHEYLFLLSKRERYYYDAAAIAEPPSSLNGSGNKERKPASARGVPVDTDGFTNGAVAGSIPWHVATSRNRRSVWTVTTQPYAEAHFATFPTALVEPCVMAGSRVGDVVLDPFIGSGTVAQVAQNLGRRYLGCELNPAYVALSERRTAQQAMVLE